MEPKFQHFFEKIAWLALTAVALYAATQLRHMATDIGEVSTNFKVFTAVTDEKLITFEKRLTHLEEKRR